MRVRQPVNYFAVNEVRVNVIGFKDIDVPISLDLRMFYSLDAERIIQPTLTTDIECGCSTTIQVVHDIDSLTDILSSYEDGTGLWVAIETPETVASTNSTFRLSLLIPAELGVVPIKSTYGSEYDIIKYIWIDTDIILGVELGQIVRDVSILNHRQYIDSEFGIPTRLNVFPMPVQPKLIVAKSKTKDSVSMTAPVEYRTDIQSGTEVSAQRVREYSLGVPVKFNVDSNSIVRYASLNTPVCNAAVTYTCPGSVLYSLDEGADLVSKVTPIRIITLRNGLPGTSIKFEDFSSITRYRHIVIPYVEDI